MTNLAYGFVGLEHLNNERVSQVGVERIFTAVQESAAEHNRVINALMASFVQRTTTAQEQFELPSGGTLQPLDEYGNPLPMRPTGSYQVAYPIQGGGTAWGTNRVTAAMMTVQETNRHVVTAQNQDADWLRRHIMAAVLDNTTWTFDDEIGPNGAAGLGSITIQPLANGDSVTYVKSGSPTPTTDDHYLGQALAISDANNPFPAIYDDLMEHPSNQGGDVIHYIATSLKATVKALADFVAIADPDIRLGSASDVTTRVPGRAFGDEVLGKVKNAGWIVEWKALPDDYILSHATGGGPVLKMREYPAEEIQGFFPEPFNEDGNRKTMRMIRYAGFGVGNRVAAHVAYIGNATYQVPAAYATPLAA